MPGWASAGEGVRAAGQLLPWLPRCRMLAADSATCVNPTLTPAATQPGCTDAPNWVNKKQNTCKTYGEAWWSGTCGQNGHDTEFADTGGKTADDACCVCGGGTPVCRQGEFLDKPSNQCKAIAAECTSVQYQASQATKTSDRECKALATCAAGMYVSVDPTATSNRGCERCADGEYSGAANEPRCEQKSKCQGNEYAAAGTDDATRDVACELCGDDFATRA